MKHVTLLTVLLALASVDAHRSERHLAVDDTEESWESNFNKRRAVKKHDYERYLKRKSDFISAREAVHGEGSDPSLPTQVLVKFSSEAGRVKAIAAAQEVVNEFVSDHLLVVSIDEGKFDELLGDGDIEDIEVDGVVHGGSFDNVPTNKNNVRQLDEITPYGIRMIEANQLEVGTNPVTVCVLDTGYALGHPDLPNDVRGTNAGTRNWEWDQDFNGHGTHIAGTISGISSNSKGVTGAGSIPLHIARALDRNQNGFESTVLAAVDDCVNAGAKIVSMSLGGSNSYTSSKDFYEKHTNAGVLFVAAAGNAGKNIDLFPASYPSVISVAAVYPWKNYWEFSNYGRQVELAAPGYKVLSTYVSANAVHTSSQSYPAQPLLGTNSVEVQGTLIDCGSGHKWCKNASWGICLMYHDGTSLKSMIRRCQRGGGFGAVIWDAAGRDISDIDTKSNFPVLIVSRSAGLELLENAIGETVALGYADKTNDVEYTYKELSGTSMATPHVAAAAALVWSHHPNCNNEQIRYALAKTAEDRGLAGCDYDYGFGIVQAKKAHEYLKQNDCLEGNWNQRVSEGGCSTLN